MPPNSLEYHRGDVVARLFASRPSDHGVRSRRSFYDRLLVRTPTSASDWTSAVRGMDQPDDVTEFITFPATMPGQVSHRRTSHAYWIDD